MWLKRSIIIILSVSHHGIFCSGGRVNNWMVIRNPSFF